MNDGSHVQASQLPANVADTQALEFLTVLLRRKKNVFGIPALIAVLVAVGSLFMPDEFKANTRILPPQQAQSGAAALMAQLSGVAGVAAATGIKNPNDLYLGMLKSRRIGDRMIARFNLKTLYDKKYDEQVRRELESNTSIASGKDGLINIEVEDTDPKRAAAMANAYAEELLKVTKELAVTEASQRRMFFEKQLEMSKDNLVKAEASLKGGLEQRGMVSVDAQSRAIVETMARLRAQVAAKEIQLRSMQSFVTTDNQEYKRASQELSSMKTELAKLEGSNSPSQELTPVEKGDGGLANVKLLRDVKYYQMLYELLSKQYEIARLDEAKDASIIQVLDEAVVPERKVKPKRAILVMMSLIMALFAMLVYEYCRFRLSLATEDSSKGDSIRRLKQAFRGA